MDAKERRRERMRLRFIFWLGDAVHGKGFFPRFFLMIADVLLLITIDITVVVLFRLPDRPEIILGLILVTCPAIFFGQQALLSYLLAKEKATRESQPETTAHP